MGSPQSLLHNILSDMKVELADEFDRNFERKGFFGDKWTPRKNTKGKGTLLHVTGKMRRSIRAGITGRGVRFTSPLPYTGLHNQGGKFTQNVKAHTKKIKKGKNKGKTYSVRSHTRTLTMPQRQFIGDHPKVQEAIKAIIYENLVDYFSDLAQTLKK